MGYVGPAPATGSVTSSDITDGTIANADIASDAAIALSKTALSAGTGITLSTNTLNVDAAQTGITSVGALNAGSITSGFTSIDVGAGAISTTGVITGGGLTVGSAVLIEAELEMIDGITAGTAAASKAVVLDGSKNIATIGTIGSGAITATGTSSFATAIRTPLIEFTDGDDAITIVDGGGVTFAQDVTMTSGKGILLDSLPDSDNEFSGFFAAFANATGSTISQGAVVYHTGTANQVALARANADSTMPAIAIATADVGNGASGNFMLMGICYDASLAALGIGGEVYVSEDTAGAVTATLPASAGDRVQVVGIGMHADKMIFNPDYTVVERA